MADNETLQTIEQKLSVIRREAAERALKEQNESQEEKDKKRKEEKEQQDILDELSEAVAEGQALLFAKLSAREQAIVEEYMNNMKKTIDEHGVDSEEADKCFRTMGMGRMSREERRKWARRHRDNDDWKNETDLSGADIEEMDRENCRRRRHHHRRDPGNNAPGEDAATEFAEPSDNEKKSGQKRDGRAAARADDQNFKNAADATGSFKAAATNTPAKQDWTAVPAPDRTMERETATTSPRGLIPGQTS